MKVLSRVLQRAHSHRQAKRQGAQPVMRPVTTDGDRHSVGAPGLSRSRSAVVLPVAAPLAPAERLAARIDPHLLAKVDVVKTAVPALGALLLPHILEGSREGRWVVKNHLLAVQGEQLVQLKQWLETHAPGALHKFVFSCPVIEPFRQCILAHMAENAPPKPVDNYLLSDIDNTFVPSRDRRYPKTAVTYPGRKALFEVVLGKTPDAKDHLTFLSARFGNAVLPWKFLSHRERRVTFANLARSGVDDPKVMFGSVLDLPIPTWRGLNWAPLGRRKLENFKRQQGLFPEFCYIFFGDSCEDDLSVAAKMLRWPRRHVAAAFIHDFGVAGRRFTEAQRQAAVQAGVIFYQTIPGAALAAYRAAQQGAIGLRLSAEDVWHVARGAQQDLAAMDFADRQQRRAAEAALAADLDAIARELGNPP